MKSKVITDVSKFFFRTADGPTTLITFDDPPEKIFEKIQRFSFQYRTKVEDYAAVAAVQDPDDPDNYVINPRYDALQLEMLEDCYVSDSVINGGINTLTYSIVSKHGKTVLDTRKEFMLEKERRAEVSKITKNKKYIDAKIKVDELLSSEDIDFHSIISDLESNQFVYGRAAIYIVKDENDVPTNYILLDSRRLGKVKVNKITKKVSAVEYLDMEMIEETGEMTPRIFDSTSTGQNATNTKPAYIPIEDLIYLPYHPGGIARNSKYVGYSKLEPVIHISQVKRIIMNENVKEAAKTHYAGIAMAKFDPNTPDEILANFVSMLKQAAGKWFGYKVPAEIKIEKIPTDLEKYAPLVDLINREIIRCIGIASFLLGYEQIANYANSEQILLASRETTISHLRTRLRDFIQHKVLDPLFKFYLKGTVEEDTADQVEGGGGENADEDKYVKLTYEMQDLNFTTKKEMAELLDIVKRLVPKLPDEAILRSLGFDDWVEEVNSAKEKEPEPPKNNFNAPPMNPFLGSQALQNRDGGGGGNQDQGQDKKDQGKEPPPNQNAAYATIDPDIKKAQLDLIATIKRKYEHRD